MSPELMIRISAKRDYDATFNQTVADAQRVSAALATTGSTAGTAMRGAGVEVSNLAAQFNDIGVMLASGQSPLLLAIQQGTQISQVLGPMGARQAVTALGTALMSLVSPVSLITIGSIAAGAALIQWIMSAKGDIPSATEAIDQHAEAIRGVKSAFGDAISGLDAYEQRSRELAAATLRRSNEILAAATRTQNTSFIDQLTGEAPVGDIVNGIRMVRVAKDEYEAFSNVVLKFATALENGTADFDAFNREVAAIGASRPELQSAADEIILLGESAYDLWQAGRAGADGINEIGAAAYRNIGQMRAMADAFSALADIGQPRLDDRASAAQQRDLVMANPTASASDRMKAAQAYARAIARVDSREDEEEALRLSREGAGLADRQAEAYERVVEALRHETGLVGLSAREQEVLNNIRDAGVTASSEQGQEIRRLTEYLYDEELATRALERSWDQVGDVARGAIEGLTDALDDGKLSGEELNDILKDIAKQMLRIDWGALFSTSGPALTNPLSFLFGGFRANGGDVVPGKSYIVGEKGPETFTTDMPGRIIPNVGSGGGAKMEVHIHPPAGHVAREETTETPGGRRTDVYFDRAVAQTVGKPGSATQTALKTAGKIVRR